METQELRMQLDVVKNPGTTGVYRGINWRTRRPYGTYLCGYVDTECGDVMYAKLDKIAHGGLTAEIGFDCAHAGDYMGGPLKHFLEGVYRDHDYVVGILQKMIDAILDD